MTTPPTEDDNAPAPEASVGGADAGTRTLYPYTYEDARNFREANALPLTWEDRCPAPPTDRVAFTQLILNVAEDSGLGFPALRYKVCRPEDNPSLIAFQRIVHRHTHRQSVHGLPASEPIPRHQRPLRERIYTWSRYVILLEDDYYEPWWTAYMYGVGGAEAVLPLLQPFVTETRPDPLFLAKILPPPAKPMIEPESGFRAGGRIAQWPSAGDGREIQEFVREEMGLDVRISEERTLGLRGDWPKVAIPALAGIVCLTAPVAGAVAKWYSAWLLLLLLPVALVLAAVVTFALGSWVSEQTRLCWVDRRLTFARLAQRIAEAKQREWDAVREHYEATALAAGNETDDG